MDIRNLCSSGKKSSRTIILARDYNNTSMNIVHDDHVPRSSSPTSPYKPTFWKVLFWKRLKMKKRNKSNNKKNNNDNKDSYIHVSFEAQVCRSRRAVVVPYDPFSYSRNFDRGFAWDDHDHDDDDDNLSRSFSFRFSDPSNVDYVLVEQL